MSVPLLLGSPQILRMFLEREGVEYDTPASGRGSGHQSRITSNDTNAEVILLIVP